MVFNVRCDNKASAAPLSTSVQLLKQCILSRLVAFSSSFKKQTATQEQDPRYTFGCFSATQGDSPRHLNTAAHPKSEILTSLEGIHSVFLLFSPPYPSPGLCWLWVSSLGLWIVQVLMQPHPYHESISRGSSKEG